MIERLQKLNPGLGILPVDSPEFAAYGQVLTGYDFRSLIDLMRDYPVPATTNCYIPEVEAAQDLPIHQQLSQELYGQMPIQIGFGGGYCLKLNALEWHKGNEVNVAISDFVVMLARLQDIKNGQLHTDSVRTFYLRQGQAIEIFSTTLHYSPCNVGPELFRMVVVLPQGTNRDLDRPPAHGSYLAARNKWLIAHAEASAEIAAGAAVGLIGENLTLKI